VYSTGSIKRLFVLWNLVQSAWKPLKNLLASYSTSPTRVQNTVPITCHSSPIINELASNEITNQWDGSQVGMWVWECWSPFLSPSCPQYSEKIQRQTPKASCNPVLDHWILYLLRTYGQGKLFINFVSIFRCG